MVGATSSVGFETLVEGASFTECPRWRDGELWFTSGESVNVVTLDGATRVAAQVPTGPSGLGWLPDGRLLVVSVTDKRVLRQEPDGTMVVHADLADVAPWPLNDMVVDSKGRGYVGSFGLDYFSNGEVTPTQLYRVDPDGSVRVLSGEVTFPNGLAFTADESVLVVAESFSNRMSAFDVASDGSLSNQREWARFGPPNPTESVTAAMAAGDVVPDGIVMDAEGAVWAADPQHHRVVRVREGGEIIEEIATPNAAFACELGGSDGHTLFVCVGPYVPPPVDMSGATGGYAAGDAMVLTTRVAVPAQHA